MSCLQLPGWSVSVQFQLWEVKPLKEMCAFTSAAEKGLGSQCAGFGGCLEGLPILRIKVLPVLPAFCLPSSWLLKTCPQARLPRDCRKGWFRLCFPWVHRAISLCLCRSWRRWGSLTFDKKRMLRLMPPLPYQHQIRRANWGLGPPRADCALKRNL